MTKTNENQPYVLADVKNHVLWLSMNRPNERNPLSGAMLNALHQQIITANENDDVRVIVITGEGGVFSAGHDLKEMSGRKEHCEPNDAKRIKTILDDCTQFMMSLIKSPKAVIACVLSLIHI